MKKRKGQFFIVGAVVIAVMLYSVWGLAIKPSSKIDFSDMQINEASSIVKEIEEGLYTSINCSTYTDTDAIQDCMDSFIELAEKKYEMKGIHIYIVYANSEGVNPPPYSALMTTEIRGYDYYVKKDIVVPYYFICESAQYNINSWDCSNVDSAHPILGYGAGIGTKVSCCKAYGMCCD